MWLQLSCFRDREGTEVAGVLEILLDELRGAMALAGVGSLDRVDVLLVAPPHPVAAGFAAPPVRRPS